MLRQLLEIHYRDLIDVAFVTVLLFAALTWLRRTRARLALVGVGMLAVVYGVAQRLDLELTAWILRGFFAAFVLVLVVVFQEDLRRFFEQIAVLGLRRRPPPAPPGAADVLVRTVARLAAARTGALLVLPGRDPLERHVQGGIALGGSLSEPLLLSLFDPHSPGHDGAAVIEGDRIARFAVHLPLSTDGVGLGTRGTRHAAGLGLAERTDALSIVVSEEKGTVSVARDGRLRTLPRPEALGGELRRFFAAQARKPAEQRSLWRRVPERWGEALLAAGIAFGMWLLLVPGATVTEMVREVPVSVENLPAGYEVEGIEPEQVEVTLSGAWRDLYLSDPSALRVRIDAFLVQLGRRTFEVTPAQVRHPKDLEVLDVSPASVRLSVRKVEPTMRGPAAGGRRLPQLRSAPPRCARLRRLPVDVVLSRTRCFAKSPERLRGPAAGGRRLPQLRSAPPRCARC